MAVETYVLAEVNWGIAQSSGTRTTALALSTVGYTAIDSHEVIRAGAYAFDTGSNVSHTFMVCFEWTTYLASNLIFRLQDVTNALTISTITPGSSTVGAATFVTSTTFANLPAANARVELQYTMTSTAAAKFYAAAWYVNRWAV